MPTWSFLTAAMCANFAGDGLSCLSWPANVSPTSIELTEHIAPLRVHHKRLRPDSGGPGQHRGGLGQEVLMESLSEKPIAVSFLAERTAFPALGIDGGEAGAPGILKINGSGFYTKNQYILNCGDTVLMATPGGGGYGNPATRRPTAKAAD